MAFFDKYAAYEDKYDYPDEREIYLSRKPEKPSTLGDSMASGALGGAFYGSLGGMLIGAKSIKGGALRGSLIGTAAGAGLALHDKYRYKRETEHPEEFHKKLESKWEKQGLPLLHWSEKHYADNAPNHPHAPKGYTAEQALKDYRRSNHKNRPYLDDFAWEAEGLKDEVYSDACTPEFKELPKIASLALAAKVLKGAKSKLADGASNLAFSAAGAGFNQAQPKSNNFNMPESEG